MFDGPTIHLALNHVPVIGSAGILLILLLAVVLKREAYTRLALGLAVLVALVTIPVLRSGEPAEKRIEHQPGVEERWIEPHEDLAQVSAWVMFCFGAIAALALFAARGGRALASWVTPVALAFALGASTLMAITAHRGGMIRHLELRPGYTPAAAPAGEKADEDAPGKPPAH